MKLSLVVPAYNVEKYLDRCLKSLICQDIPETDYEIIVVNDGSTDCTFDIINKWVQESFNVICINQENKGLSEARNSAIRAAKGRYLVFVDSDDYVEPNCFGELLMLAEKNKLDVLQYAYTPCEPVVFTGKYDTVYSGKSIVCHCVGIWSAWRQLVRTELIRENNLYFTPDITSEDAEVFPRLYWQADRVMVVDRLVYHYEYNPTSITKERNFNMSRIEKRLSSQFVVLKSISELMAQPEMDETTKESLKQSVIYPALTAACSMLFRTPISFNVAAKYHKLYMQSSYYPVISSSQHSFRVRVMYFIMNSLFLFKLFYLTGLKYIYFKSLNFRAVR